MGHAPLEFGPIHNPAGTVIVVDSKTRHRLVVWMIIGTILVLYGCLRLGIGPMPQDLSYHALADTRILGAIPHAGDVLTNLAILGAGLFGLALRPRMTLAPEERVTANVLIVATILTAFGSTYYHWAPANVTMVWDRIPISVVLMAALALVMADRMSPKIAREALWPFTGLGIASAILWGVSEAAEQGDLLLYFIVRKGAGVAIALLLILRQPRHTGTKWLVAALLCEVIMAALERFDHEVLSLTGGLVSGHNLKHLIVGVALGLVFWWLRVRQVLPVKSAL